MMDDFIANKEKTIFSKAYDMIVKPFTLEVLPKTQPPDTNVFTYSLFYVFFD